MAETNSCEKCRAAHAATDNSGRAARFAEASEKLCGCEGHKVSEHSSGPVQDNERLHFVVTDPQWLMEGGKIHPAVLMRVDTGGLSVLRDTATDAEFETTMVELSARANAANKECYFHGTLGFAVYNIRYCMSDRFLCVYDTGLVDKPNHAELMSPPLDGPSKSQIEKKRRALIKEIGDVISREFTSAEAFRGGLLKKYARQ